MENIQNDGFDNDENIIVLYGDDGSTIEAELSDNIEYDGQSYMVFIPLDENSNEAIIMRVDEEDEDSGEITFGPIEDEKVLNKIFDIFKKNHSEE